jgi:uncharacterized protein (TIGR03663 family)
VSRRKRARERRASQGAAANAGSAERAQDTSRPAPGSKAPTPVDSQPTAAEPAAAPAIDPAKGHAVAGQRPLITETQFVALALLILVAAAGLRLLDLSLNPFHHDEGINGWFVTNLMRQGHWVYDPANYHGPTLFHFGLASAVIFGLTDEAMRLVPVLFGLGTVALVLALRPFVGSVAALTGGALLALSPGATYVSRYFIHESLVVFFTLAIVVALLYLLHTRKQRYLVLAAASVALLFATKETGIVSLAVLAIATGMAIAYVRLRRPVGGDVPTRTPSRRSSRRAAASADTRPGGWRAFVTAEGALAAAVTFGVLYTLFFTSFLDNPRGLVDSLATFTIWTQTGTETQVQPIQQYLVWMLQADAAILLLGFAGGLIVAWRATDRVAVFIGLWALGITMAYSLVAYKTPWIALNMVVPLAIVAGLGVAYIASHVRSQPVRAAATAALAAGLALGGYQSVDLNFVRYDDDQYPYVFVHTTRDALRMIAETERIAGAAGSNAETGIVVVSPEYWPLPWYYRNYPRAGFFGQVVPTEEHMIIARADQQEELEAAIGDAYRRTEMYNLRPGVDLVLYVRQDLADL